MSLQKQPEYNKGLFMYNEAPEYITNLYIHIPRAIPVLGTITYSKQVYPSLVLICGTTYLWQSDLVSHSAPSSVNFVHTLK